MPIVASGLRLWWNKSQGQSGTTWSDLSGNGYDGTLTGSAVFTSGNAIVTGGGINFNNPISDQGTTDQEWTVEAWMAIPSGTTTTARYLVKYWNKGLYVPFSTGKAILYNNSGTYDYYMYSTNTVTISTTYHHWVFRFRNSDSTMKITYDNTDVSGSSTNVYTPSTPYGISPALILASAATVNIGVFRVYNRMLTDAEVSQNYTVGTTYAPISVSTTQTVTVATASSSDTTPIVSGSATVAQTTATATVNSTTPTVSAIRNQTQVVTVGTASTASTTPVIKGDAKVVTTTGTATANTTNALVSTGVFAVAQATVATATATAKNPVIYSNNTLVATRATASTSSTTPVVSGSTLAVTTAGTASSQTRSATIIGNALASVVRATATALAKDPVIKINVIIPVTVATATAKANDGYAFVNMFDPSLDISLRTQILYDRIFKGAIDYSTSLKGAENYTVKMTGGEKL